MMNPTDVGIGEFGSAVTSAATIVYIQNWLKTRDFYARFVVAFPGSDEYAHWIIAGTASLIAAAGIHLTWNYDLIKGGQFAGTIPSLRDMLHGMGDWFQVYIYQHTIYKQTHEAPYAPPQVKP